jgi:hypothetical protein
LFCLHIQIISDKFVLMSCWPGSNRLESITHSSITRSLEENEKDDRLFSNPNNNKNNHNNKLKIQTQLHVIRKYRHNQSSKRYKSEREEGFGPHKHKRGCHHSTKNYVNSWSAETYQCPLVIYLCNTLLAYVHAWVATCMPCA